MSFRLLLSLLCLLWVACAPKSWAQQAALIPVVVTDQARDPYAIGISQTGGSWLLGGGSTQPNYDNAALLQNRRILPLLGSTNQTPLNRVWLGAEWLLWDVDGMDTPALVTSSSAGTAQNQAAFLGGPTTSILFGNTELNDGTVNGFRVNGGFWITPSQTFGIEGEYFRLGEQDDRYFGSSDGSTIIGRSFFDIVAGQETAQLISFPGLVSGDISVNTETDFQSAMVVGRAALCPSHGLCQCRRDRVDWIVGYRFMELDDVVDISENLTSQTSAAPGTIALRDRFTTDNHFHGLQLGVVHRANFRLGYLESMLRVALGNNEQTIRISGNTAITEGGVTDTFNGGLLAQRSNIGTYRRDEFVMVPEIGVKLGVRVTNFFSVSAGYMALYLPNVVRAAEQIDTDLNPNLVAPETVPFVGALRPRFMFVQNDYWAHGLTLGGELNF